MRGVCSHRECKPKVVRGHRGHSESPVHSLNGSGCLIFSWRTESHIHPPPNLRLLAGPAHPLQKASRGLRADKVQICRSRFHDMHSVCNPLTMHTKIPFRSVRAKHNGPCASTTSAYLSFVYTLFLKNTYPNTSATDFQCVSVFCSTRAVAFMMAFQILRAL